MTRLALIVLWATLLACAVNAQKSKAEASAQAVAYAGSEEQSDEGSEVECSDEEPDSSTEAPVTTTTEEPKLQCGPNEVLEDCSADCPADYCPKSEAEAKSTKFCSQPENCPAPKCKCQFNYRRAENGTCIPTRSCPAFECSGENEEFTPCPPLCPSDDCSQASPTGRCPPQFGNILIVLECAPTCRCKEGYWRKNGVCVPYNQCKAPNCGKNEVLVKCAPDCPSNYCPKSEAETKQVQKCNQPDNCPAPACQCAFNHRRAENGTCIPTEDCPPFECSGINEEYNPCPPFCPSDDCSHATPDGRCHIFGRIGIRLICNPKCRCLKGYWRKNGVCVPYAECKPKPKLEPKCTGPNEEYSLEKASCPPQECNSLVARIDCRNAPPPAPGCVCQSGFMRLNATSPCIPVCECPQMRYSPECEGKTGAPVCSGPNEEYTQEKPSCPPQECFSLVARIDCRNAPPPQPGCACKPGYLRESPNSPCVKTCQCPQMSGSPDC